MCARRFKNCHGERWVLRFHAESGHGELLGDETGWMPVRIRSDVVAQDFILSADEAIQLEEIWLRETGRLLILPLWNQMLPLVERLCGEVG